MVSNNSFSEKIKNSYYFFEDKWYSALDKIDSKLPIYKVIDPVDKIIPSFILFLLIILFLIILLGYLIQFGSGYEVIFTTYDSTTKNIISGVNLEGLIYDDIFRGSTNTNGTFSVDALGPSKNIYAVIGTVLFGAADDGYLGFVNANKEGYDPLERIELNVGKEQDLFLQPAADEAEVFNDSTIIELVDDDTSRTIIDNTSSAYVRFTCNNRQANTKTVRDDADGSLDGEFELIEDNCEFKVLSAYAPGYETKNTSEILPKSIDKHRIRLDKENIVTTGTAKIYVYNQDGNGLIGIKVNLNNKIITTNNSGVAEFKDLQPGEYLVTINDENYYAITADDDIKVNVEVGKIAEEEITLVEVPLGLRTRFYFKLVDDVNGNFIEDAEVSILATQIDGNNLAVIDEDGKINYVTNNKINDINGVYGPIPFTTATSRTIKAIAVVNKNGYLIKAFTPTLFKFDEGPETIELTKATASNSGNANVLVTTLDNNVVLYPSNTFILMGTVFNSTLVNNIPLPSKNGLKNNQDGIANFERLPVGLNYNYLAGAEYEEIFGKTNDIKKIDANETLNFHVKIDYSISKINVILIDAIKNEEIRNSSNKVILLNNSKEKIEELSYSNGEYNSGFYRKDKTYYLRIDSNTHVSTTIKISNLAKGTNELEIKLWPLPNNDGSNIDDDNITDGNVLIMLSDIYNLNDRIFSGKSTAFELNNGSEYWARFDAIIAKDGLDYNKVLSMIRINGAKITGVQINPDEDYTQKNSFSCSNQNLDNVSKNNRGDEYYLPTESNCNGDLRIVAGAKWDKNNIEPGVYSLAIKFEVDNNNNVEFKYRAREYNSEGNSETRLKTSTYPVGVAFRAGFYISIQIERDNLSFTRGGEEDIKSAIIDADKNNNIRIRIFNNEENQLNNGNLTIYSHNGALDKFNELIPNGDIIFSNGENVEILENSINIESGRSRSYSTKAFTTGYNTSQYILVISKFGNKEFRAIINTSVKGRPVTVATEFFSGIPNQLFDGDVFARAGNPRIESLNVVTYSNCSDLNSKVAEYYFDDGDIEINENNFSFIIDGTYNSNACMDFDLIASEKTSGFLYAPYSKIIRAGQNNALDLTLGCIDVRTPDGSDENTDLEWGEERDIEIINNCGFNTLVNIETALKCKQGTNNCSTQDGISLEAGQTKNYIITGENSSYNSNADVPNFTDILGNFPIYVKAKKTDNMRARFSLVDKFNINLINSEQCFAINRSSFDLRESIEDSFVITNDCQYTLIGDYFIPRINLNAFGYSLFDENLPNQNFGVNIVVNGASYSTESTIESRDIFGMGEVVYANDVNPISIDNNTNKYIVNFDIKNEILNSDFGIDWNINKIQFKVVDLNRDTNQNFGAKIDGDIKVNRTDGTSFLITPAYNFDINPFGCNANSPHPNCEEIVVGGRGYIVGEDNFIATLFYEDIEDTKIDSIDINFIGGKETEYLEFSTNFHINYDVNVIRLVEDATNNPVDDTVLVGNFSIESIEGVDFIISNLNNLEAFNTITFKGKINPKVRIETNNPKVMAWVDRGYLIARYIGENNPSFDDKTIESKIIKGETAVGTVYGIVTINDYVSTIEAINEGKEISGGN